MKHITAFFLSAVLLLSLCVTVIFGHEAPDLGKKGTITIQWKFQDKALPDGALRAFQIGTLQDIDGDFSFAPLSAFEDKDLSEENLTPELAKELAGMVKTSDGIMPSSFEDGVVTFDGLELGLYLIVQTKNLFVYEKITPFLVSVPLWDEDHYLYEIGVSEKFELKKRPSVPDSPDEPGDTLPQTGQVKWPVPVLLTIGLMLIVSGATLRRKSKYAQ